MAIYGDTRKQKNMLFVLYFFGCGAVAICGDMWRYPKKTMFFLRFFSKAVALWRFVAICGDTRKQETLLFFVFFLAVAICGNTQKTQKHIYVAIPENRNICDFLYFWAVAQWRYLAM